MDKNNFSEIYKKYVMTAYSAAMQVVHNEADADDIAQETMVKLYLNIDALDEDRVEGWVRVAAKNLGIDYQRKAQRFDWNELDEDLRAEEMELPTLAEEEKQERNHFFQEVMDALGCADNKATKLFRELEKFGLIERKRRGLGKPNLIYVKNFADPRFRNREKNGSGAADSAQQETAKSRGNKTEWNKTEGSEPDPFSSDAEDESDERTRLEAYFMQSLEVDLLLRACPDEEDTIHQIVNLLVDTCSSKRRMLRVAGDDKPAEVVRSRFMKLNVLERHCNQAKIPVISVHGLRHTHASVLLFAGVSIASVARRLGHSSMTTTQKTYLHIIRELENQDIDLVMRSLSGLS